MRMKVRNMPKIVKKEVAMIMCERCGYTWKPRVKNPVKCVNCGHRFKSKPKGGGQN